MTTANETNVEVDVSKESTPRCEVKWWDLKQGRIALDFECGSPATHLLRAHSGANLANVTHTTEEMPVCERCLNEAMLLYCEMHNVPAVESWSVL